MELQKIFYGAPGTGKSHTIDEKIKETENYIRTTFHPDSDYSTYVGAYKPKMEGDKIVYGYVDQAFLKSYIAAWKDTTKPYYLIIEEINRGNCAQIFGDIFQLLDRDEAGFSNYPIVPDSDIQTFIAKELEKANLDGVTNLPEKASPDAIKSGTKMVLPSNLHIWASMNTSDQSLFPMDSAFKRRWNWVYMPIKDADKGWKIDVDGTKYDWWSFLEAINKVVYSVTQSEDKQLGYFFVKADKDGVISADTFVNKVIFYLWNDVFKDYGFEHPALQDENGDPLSFKWFFGDDGVDSGKVNAFLDKLNVSEIEHEVNLDGEIEHEVNLDGEIEHEVNLDGENVNDVNGEQGEMSQNPEVQALRGGRYTSYDGTNFRTLSQVFYYIAEKYVAAHAEENAEQVSLYFEHLRQLYPYNPSKVIRTENEYNAELERRISNNQDWGRFERENQKSIPCAGQSSIRASRAGWSNNPEWACIAILIYAINQEEWGRALNIQPVQ